MKKICAVAGRRQANKRFEKKLSSATLFRETTLKEKRGMRKNRQGFVSLKLKPWGEEIWFAHTDKYAGKILCVKKGHRLSLQYHEKKHETQYLYKGKIQLTYGKNTRGLKTKILKPGDKFEIPPYTIHRVKALEDSEIFEVSTPELTDVVRLTDDYGRTDRNRANLSRAQKTHK